MPRRLIDSPWPYFVAAGLLALVAIASQFELRLPSRSVAPPEQITSLRDREDLNVIFILIDTLRSDRLSAYGYGRPTSPNIDALASRGVLFRNALSQSSWTKSSMASLWTGTYPANNGVVRYNHVLPDAAVMPAEILKEMGYRTAGIWRNGWVAPNFGFGQGFDIYLNPKPGMERQRIQRGHPSQSNPLQGTDEDIVVAVNDYLDGFGRDRFLLYLHFMDLHQYVYDEGAAPFGNSYSDTYDKAINWIDRLVSLVVNKVDEIGELQNTIFVIASDHGEAFQEHGFEGHARNLYSEVVRVPVIFSLPFSLDPGIVVDEQVSNVDVWPTILDLLGAPPLPNTDGHSLVPLMLEAAGVGPRVDDLRRPAIAQLDRRWGTPKESDPMVSVTDGDMRIIWWAEGPEQRNQVYDLAADPGEHKNLWDPGSEVSAQLAEEARSYYEAGKSPWGAGAYEVELDELRLNQLRALGYVIR